MAWGLFKKKRLVYIDVRLKFTKSKHKLTL